MVTRERELPRRDGIEACFPPLLLLHHRCVAQLVLSGEGRMVSVPDTSSWKMILDDEWCLAGPGVALVVVQFVTQKGLFPQVPQVSGQIVIDLG